MALSSDGRWLAASSHFDAVCPGQCEVIRLYDFATGELKARLRGHRNKAVSLAFSPDGTKLISGSGDTSAIIWDVERGTPLHRLQGHPDFIYAVGFTPDGARAVTASYDTLRLWRVADGVLIKEMKRPLMSNEIRAPGVVWVSSDEITRRNRWAAGAPGSGLTSDLSPSPSGTARAMLLPSSNLRSPTVPLGRLSSIIHRLWRTLGVLPFLRMARA
jgi:WD40 repeat protein